MSPSDPAAAWTTSGRSNCCWGLARSFITIPNRKHQAALCSLARALAEPCAKQFNGSVPLLDKPG